MLLLFIITVIKPTKLISKRMDKYIWSITHKSTGLMSSQLDGSS